MSIESWVGRSVLADSDVLMDALNGVEPGLSAIRREMSSRELATSALNAFEVLQGAVTDKSRLRAMDLLNSIPVLPVDLAVATRAAEFARELRARGQSISTADAIVAGVALQAGMVVMTRNQKDFGRVPGLEVLSP